MSILRVLVDLLILVMVCQAVLTWIPTHPDSPLYSVQAFLTRVVNPIYAPVRRVIPPIRAGSGMAVDIAPMIVILVLLVVVLPLVSAL